MAGIRFVCLRLRLGRKTKAGQNPDDRVLPRGAGACRTAGPCGSGFDRDQVGNSPKAADQLVRYKEGTRISGVLIAPVTEGGDMLLPLGTTVEGSVVSVRKVGLGVVHETARIQLQFDRVLLSDGKSFPLQCRITEVENAREAVDKEGRIQGIRSTSTLSYRASGVVGSLAFGDPIAAIFTTAASASSSFSEPEISLPWARN